MIPGSMAGFIVALVSSAIGRRTLSGTLTGTILTSGNSVTISTPVYSKSDTMTLTATATAGETSLTAVTSGNIVFSAGPAAKLVYTTVPSTGTAGTTFSVTVQSQDVNGNPASPTSNTTITLSKASGGGTLSGTLTGTIPTSGNSVTISTPVYSKSDTMTLTATATAGETSLTAVTSSNIVFSSGAATQLVFSTQPGGGTAATAWSQQPVVTLEDANGNTVTGTVQNVTLTIQNNAGPGGVLSGTTTMAVNTSTGLATFSGLSINKNGTAYTLTATGSTVDTTAGTVVSSAFNITVGPATQVLVETAANGSGTVVPAQNVASGSTLTVYSISRDAGNNFVANVSATWTLVNLTGGVVAGDLSPATGTSATFTGHLIGTAAIHAVSGSLTTTNSGTITVIAGTANKLAFTTSPSNGTGGIAFGTQPAVTLQDANGNTVTGTAQNVTLAIQNNAGPGGVLGGTTTVAVNTSTGLATFSGISINKAGTGYTLTATGSTVDTTTGIVVSSAFNITAGPATQLAFTTQPGGGTGGTAWSTQPVVKLEDAGGNAVTGSAQNVTLAIQNNAGPGGVLSGTTTVAANTSTGLATFSGLSINTKGTGYTLTATGSTVDTTAGTVVSSAFNITVGSATRLIFTSTPATCGYSTSFPCSPEPTVAVEDAGGNIVTTDNSHQVALAGSTNNIHCDQGNPATMTVVSGVAAFTNCWFNSHTGSETLTATSSGLTSTTSSTFTMYSAAANVVFVQQPTNTTHLVTITPPVTVQLQDGSGDNVPESGVSITLSITTGGTGTLSGTLTQVTSSSGLATFNNLSINLTGSKKLTAASSGLSSVTSSTFSIQ